MRQDSSSWGESHATASAPDPKFVSSIAPPADLCAITLTPTSVIHFINSFEDARVNLPDLVAGHGPKSPSSNHIGTHDYSEPPRAVIFGRAFDPAHIKELNHLCRGMGSTPIAWIAGDPTTTFPAQPGPDYAEKEAENVKRALARWRDAGPSDEDIVYY
jgi:hypothetical protein